MLVFLWIMVYCIVRHLVRRKYVLLCNKNEFTYYKAKILLNNSKKQTGGGGQVINNMAQVINNSIAI